MNFMTPLALKKLTASRNNDIDNILDITFSTEDERFGESTTVDLKPNGRDIEVTNENKKEYIEYVGKALLRDHEVEY